MRLSREVFSGFDGEWSQVLEGELYCVCALPGTSFMHSLSGAEPLKCSAEMRIIMKNFKSFLQEVDGIGTVEIILILVILLMIVVIFRSQITSIITTAFEKINGSSKTINGNISIKK